MNHLIIIGNGFDLAHGLKTRYSDFVYDFLKNAIKDCDSVSNFTYNKGGDLLKYTSWLNHYRERFPKNETELIDLFSNKYEDAFKVTTISSILSKSLQSLAKINWVDIEELYFQCLIDLLNIENKEHRMISIKNLNRELDQLKGELISYLSKEVNSNLACEDGKIKNQILDILSLSDNGGDKILVLNFNYTLIVKQYLNSSELKYFFKNISNIPIINIHGSLSTRQKHLIFGYGDETSDEFQVLKKLKDRDALCNIKSFGYKYNSNYQDLSRFCNSGPFSASVLGHSLGSSDRVLLNQIFEHRYFNYAKIFIKDEEDFESKYFNLNYIFDNPINLREKISPLDQCIEMAQRSIRPY